jgi:DNA-binding CsgD family transcriptional regulator
MEPSFVPAAPPDSFSVSSLAVSSEPRIALIKTAKDPREMHHSGVCLSARERSVVLLMGHGLSNKGIARQLNISPETVKSHVKHIFGKLMVRSRAQAVYRASALSLIRVSSDSDGLTLRLSQDTQRSNIAAKDEPKLSLSY